MKILKSTNNNFLYMGNTTINVDSIMSVEPYDGFGIPLIIVSTIDNNFVFEFVEVEERDNDLISIQNLVY